jgi:bile acid:Na+ symporter, BASS family
MLIRGLEWLERHGGVLLIAGLLTGVAVPPLASLFKPLVTPSVAVLLIATVVRLDWSQVFKRLRAPLLPLIIVLWIMIGAPLVVWAAVMLVDPPAALKGPLVLGVSSPVLVSLPAFALMMGLDGPLTLVVMVASSLLQPLIQPPMALALLGIHLEIGMGELMLRLAVLIGGSFAVAWALRAGFGEARIHRQISAIGGVGVLMLVIFGIGVMDGVLAQLIDEPARVLMFLAAVFIANFGLQAITALIFWSGARLWGMNGREGLTTALTAGNRNMAILVAALGPSAGPDLYLYLACNQFPLYLMPSLGRAIYRPLLKLRP